MEHRWSIRAPIQADVVLSIAPWKKVHATVLDISIGGISVVAEQLELPANAIVTLAFSLEHAGQTSHHRLPGQVVYCSERRAGLVFINPANETVRALRDLADAAKNGLTDRAADQFPLRA